jgi:1-acyl-sn-glycerol-3-phosphate acyltransferase
MHPLRGIVAILYMATNTVVWALLCYAMAVVRILLPRKDWRVRWAARMNVIIDGWVSCNRALFRTLLPTEIEARGVESLSRESWYLLLSNHRSWTDIVVLQTVFRDLVPPLKFFTKIQLIWIPFLGQAMWALDFPFMRRYSRAFLEKHPELRGKDLETTRRMCERFRPTPTSIIIFVEGTRFTEAKHSAQASPHRHLLKPRAGGVGFVLSAMGETLGSLVDVTITYPDGTPSFWSFLCGRVPRVIVETTVEPLPSELAGGDYERDDAFRLLVQEWVTELWEAKDARIGETLAEAQGPSA